MDGINYNGGNGLSKEELHFIINYKDGNTANWQQIILFIITFLGINLSIGFMFLFIDDIASINLAEMFFAGYKALIFEGVVFLLTLFIFKNIRQFSVEDINLSALRVKRNYLLIFGGFLFFAFSQYLLLNLFKVDSVVNQSAIFGINTVTTWQEQVLLIFSLAIITPIKEEILYRGIIYRFIDMKYNFWIALITSSVVFGLLHSSYSVSAGLMGAVFAIIYKLSNSLIIPILLHISWNLYVTLTFIGI